MRRILTENWLEVRQDQCLALRAGISEAVIGPSAGGRVLSWRTQSAGGLHDWIVPIDDRHWPAHQWPKGGIFPLAPFSNRVRDAQLCWQGKVIALDPAPGEPHALHGQALTAPWQVETASNDHAVISLAHPRGAGGWPWRWGAQQAFHLEAQRLSITLALQNQDNGPMPVGLGLHPYFTADTVQLTAATGWAHDEGLARYPYRNLQNRWQRSSGTWTTHLSGWDHQARLGWRDGNTLTLRADSPLDQMVLHSNAGRYLCVEPVTHVCDAFNLSAAGIQGTGMRVLAPDAVLTIRLDMTIRLAR